MIIKVKDIIDENFQDYKKSAMFLSAINCDFKCLKEKNLDTNICQNSKFAVKSNKSVSIENIFKRYMENPITSAIIIGGFEPMLQFEEFFMLIKYFRDNSCSDDFVIYTGYNLDEIHEKIEKLKNFKNIIVKFGRYIPGSKSRFDKTLGVNLSSENQFAQKIS